MKWLGRLALALFLSALTVSAPCASDKKGIGLSDLRATDRVAALHVSWYYTWSIHPIEGATHEMFVPMIWGGRRAQEAIDELCSRGRVPVVLAMNEPDQRKQANLSVEQVIRLWPQIEALADQVGSPAVAGNPLGSAWLTKFFRMSQARRFKPDFLAVHLYGPPNPEKFLQKLDAIHEKYGLPVWITEFAVADWNSKDRPGANRYSQDDVLAFMKAVLPELEKRDYVRRYAWFGAGKRAPEPVRTSRLFDKDGGLTPLGRYYAAFTWPAADDGAMGSGDTRADGHSARTPSWMISASRRAPGPAASRSANTR